MPHYFSEKQESAPKRHKIQTSLLGKDFNFIVESGIFSQDGVDPGSRVLIERCRLPEKGLVLDLGCGYGPVGVSLAKTHPALRFLLTDVNRRAVAVAGKNILLNGVTNAQAKWNDLYTGLDSFNVILCNPPQSAGKDLCLRIITEAKDHLIKGGNLQIVCRHNRGGKPLRKAMAETFGNVQDIAKQGGYHIYASELR